MGMKKQGFEFMIEKIFFDSDIFINAADTESLFYGQSVEIIEAAVERGFFTADLCLFQFYRVITDGRKTPIPLSPEKASLFIEKLWNTPEIDVIETDMFGTFQEAEHRKNLIRYNIAGLAIYSYLIAMCLKKNQISTIATFNSRDYKEYPWLTVIDLCKTNGCLHSVLMPSCTAPSSPRSIPYGRQSINERDVAAVCKVLRSDWLTQGSMVPSFEKAVVQYCGAAHGVAVNSATSALHIACLALGLCPGDKLWTSPITFVASANCGLYCGATVDFVDVDPRTYNLCPKALETKLQAAKKSGQLPKVVVPVHFSGQPCDMLAIYDLSQKYGFRVIEDASHALGGKYKNEPIGNCRYSDITVFSFHPVKIITTGEGGMALTNDSDLAQRMALLRTHGITRDAAIMSQASDGPWYYQQIALGFNFRMTDIQSALGISQMERLDVFVNQRRELSQRYERLLADLPVTTPWQHPDGSSAWHLYVIRHQPGRMATTHRKIFERLQEQGIGANLHYIPVHTQPYYRCMGFGPGMFPEAEKYYKEAITLPLFPAMTEGQQDRIVTALNLALPDQR